MCSGYLETGYSGCWPEFWQNYRVFECIGRPRLRPLSVKETAFAEPAAGGAGAPRGARRGERGVRAVQVGHALALARAQQAEVPALVVSSFTTQGVGVGPLFRQLASLAFPSNFPARVLQNVSISLKMSLEY